MTRLICYILAWIARRLLALRYNITVKGLEQIDHQRGVLVLPNHPGEMDPVICVSQLWNELHPHPVAVEDFYYMPGLHGLLSLFGTIPMPNMEGRLGVYKKRRVQQALDDVAEHLREGRSVLIYPAGRMMRDQVEDLRGASAVYDILQRYPEVPIVTVRTSGLLGSMFAWLTWHHRPDLKACLKRSLKILALNGLFFTPRRTVNIEVQEVGDDFPRHGDKMEINRWLENWYNLYGSEEPSQVSYTFWKKTYLDIDHDQVAEADADQPDAEIPDEVRQQVHQHIGELTDQSPDEVEPQQHLMRDLGMDSLDLGELVAWIEETYGTTDLNVEDLQTVHSVALAAVGELGETRENVPLRIPEEWLETDRPDLVPPDPELTVQENFLHRADTFAGCIAVADETSGALTWRRLKTGALLLAERFRQRPEQHIGVMLPATVGADVVVLAVLLAGKTPVMINWTLGDANLEHVLELAEIDVIVTSGRFLDRLDQLNFDLLQDKIWTLEDMRRQDFTLTDKLKAALAARRSANSLIRRWRSDTWTTDRPAVILFTSGSEAAPKGVPLTHHNVLSNLAGAMRTIELHGSDVLYGFLPPFHSFGYTVATVLPLTTGLKVAYYPNPTESRKLARGIQAWRPTIVCGTPTFINGIFKAAGDQRLDSLRIILTGAEKAADELFERAAQLSDGHVLEGYGITETGPILTLNRPGESRVGVGKPIANVELAIVDAEDRDRRLETGERGLILAHGPNIFGGYLGNPGRDAFHELDGKTWYVTGDLGSLDEDGNLTISGRLKRFVKIGGEMISLPAMESAISQKHPPVDGEPQFAVSSLDRDGERPLLALFATFETDKDGINGILKEAGFSNLARVNQVIQLEEIPKLGTGKTDYRSLKEKLREQL